MPVAATVVPTATQAQQITTSITGQVTNQSGAALGNALVLIVDTRTAATTEIRTDSSGLFTASGLQTGGPYTVTATADGFQGQTVEGIQTSLQGATQLTFSLAPVAAETTAGTIVVTAARAKVTQLEIGPGTSFNTQVLQAAPTFDRDIRDIIKADPRVSLDRQDVSTGGSGADRISCLGGNDRFNTFTVDGIPQSDIYGLNDTGFSSRSSTPVPYDAVREAQVQFAPFDVEYGQFTGCAINVVTKSGSNRFHGTGFYEFSNSDLRGDELPGISPLPNISLAPIKPDKRWGVSFGGPIIKDRLFFFGAYEKQTAGQSQDDGPVGGGFANELAGITVDQFNAISDVLRDVYGIDTGPLVHDRPFSNKRLFARLDWQITDNHRLEGTYQRLKESTVKTDDFSSTNPSVTGLNSFLNSGTDSKYYSARLYSNWTDRFSTELRYARSEIQDIQDPIGGGEAQSDNPIPRIVVGIDNPTGPDATVIAGPGFSRSANDLRTKLDQIKALANYELGDHRLKLGFEYNHANIFNLFVQQATGTLVFKSLTDLQNGILSNGTSTSNPTPSVVIGGTAAGAVINATASGDINDAAASFSRSIYSVYGQDDWRVNDQLKLVGGVRVDWYSGDHPRLNPVFENRYGFGNDTGFDDLDPVVLPRLGFTYNLPESGVIRRSRLQGGVGIFSGGDPVVWFGNVFQNNGMAFGQGVSAGSVGGVPSPCPAGPLDVVTGGTFTGVPQCVIDHASTLAATGNGFTQAVDPNLKLSTVWRANIGYQADFELGDSAFGRGWHVNLDYIYSLYKNPFTIADLSQAIDITTGLNGFAIDGRPIYRTIDPLLAGCNATLVGFNPTPTYENITATCYPSRSTNRGEYVLTNAGSYRTHVASIILQKNFDAGIFTPSGSSYFTVGYAYTNAHDRRNMYNSTAGSNFNVTAVFDRQNPDPARAFYETRHNITFSGNIREKFFSDLATSLGFTFVARSGRPYSLTFSDAGNGFRLFNAGQSSSGNGNLVYLPTGIDDPNISPSSNMTAVQSLADFAKSLDCAKKYIGRSIPRNTCSNDWYYDLDLRFSQELPGPGRLLGRPGGINDKLTAYIMFDNFLNLLDKGWNLQHRRDFGGRQPVADISGIDANGKYIISGVAPITPNSTTGLSKFDTDNFINVSGSIWRIKLGISYEF